MNISIITHKHFNAHTNISHKLSLHNVIHGSNPPAIETLPLEFISIRLPAATACQKPHLPMATTNSYNTLLQIELSEVLWEMVLVWLFPTDYGTHCG